MDNCIQCTPAELERVMDIYGKTVYRMAFSQTRSTADAEDIYQEVFLRYYQKRPQFASEEHRKAWLLRVTINRARTLFASAWFRKTVPLEECGLSFTQPEENRLHEALEKLDKKDRTLLHLFYYEELSAKEMANILGRKESTVRTQLTRARRKLAEIMKGDAYVSEGI